MIKVFDLLNGARMTAAYAEDCLAHGVEAVHITLNNYRGINPVPDLRHALNELAAYRAHLQTLSSVVHIVENAADFERARRAGKLGIVLGYQNVPGVERDLTLMELFHALGVRVVQVAHNIRNLYADGCAEPADAGLSSLGRELVAVLNELGMVIDLSHVGDRSGLDVLAASKQPVAVTHANAYALCPNARNKSDALLDALKSNGGVIGVTYLPPLVRMPGETPGMQDVVAHIRYVVERLGVAHVGIGSDFITGQPAERYQEFMRKPEVYGTWPWRYPIDDLAAQQNMLAGLADLGLSRADIQAVARDNFLRLFQTVMAGMPSAA
ncbi:MAG: membrane dipeptidase [Pigmentiphaga sp.]|uniref:dipeptidase n=1 Tax=Pigmentiphaga sp. TaxID=1977564 RepID=UPI0029B78D7F|nr:membrane dipeptidase [Pigmentiphaga sp.]MDX3906137.1 membrane dipeptidase [Pigmentiphaga sp.]